MGRLDDGLVVLAPYTLPGETVEVKPFKQKKSFMEARPISILEPSSDRATPPCPLFGSCGGCDFQHVKFAAQPRLKTAVLGEQLVRAGLLSAEELPAVLTAPLVSPLAFNYRQRIRLQIDKNGSYGFFRPGSHRIVPLHNCPLARPELNLVLEHLDDFSGVRHLLDLSTMLELFLSPAEKSVFLLFHFSRKPRPADIQAARESATCLENIGGIILEVEGRGRYGPYGAGAAASPLLSLGLKVRDKKEIFFRFEPGTFCQVNPAQNEHLLDLLLEWAVIRENSRVLDLFCGMGNFSIPLALYAEKVRGMDLQRSAIRSAMRNAEEAGLGNCHFERMSAEQGAKKCLAGQERFDLVLLDPPRSGCREVIPHVIALGPARIIYISCDPATLCRDLDILKNKGYAIRRMKMVDMFPQTHHIESVTLLERR